MTGLLRSRRTTFGPAIASFDNPTIDSVGVHGGHPRSQATCRCFYGSCGLKEDDLCEAIDFLSDRRGRWRSLL
jgi:hypothetical protein